MSDIPQLLPYPDIRHISECPSVHNTFSYIINDYHPGIACVVKLDDNISFLVGDWKSNVISPNMDEWGLCDKFLKEHAYKIASMMAGIGVTQAQLFISGDYKLVDMQISLNKFAGPGMLRDLFSNIIDTQDIVEVTTIDDDKIKSIKDKIVKPSRFRYDVIDGVAVPAYARI